MVEKIRYKVAIAKTKPIKVSQLNRKQRESLEFYKLFNLQNFVDDDSSVVECVFYNYDHIVSSEVISKVVARKFDIDVNETVVELPTVIPVDFIKTRYEDDIVQIYDEDDICIELCFCQAHAHRKYAQVGNKFNKVVSNVLAVMSK